MKINTLTYSNAENRLLKVQQTITPSDSYGNVSVKVDHSDTATVSEEAKYIQQVTKLFNVIEMFQKRQMNKIPELEANIPGDVSEPVRMLAAISDFQLRDVDGIIAFLTDGYKDGYEETMKKLGEKLGVGGALSMIDLEKAIEWIKSN